MLALRFLKNISGFLSSGGASFPCPVCLKPLYGLAAAALVSFPTCGDENTIPGRRAVSAACLSYRHAPCGVSPLVPSCVSLLGPSCLLASYPSAALIVSSVPHGSRCLSHRLALFIGSSCLLACLIGSSVRPCLVSLCSPSHRQAKRGWAKTRSSSAADSGRLLACPGMAAGGGRCRRRRAWVGRGLLVCPVAAMWRDCRFFPLSSSHPIGSVPVPRLIQSSNRRRGFLFPFARPPPVCSSLLACPGLVPPSPAGGCAGCGMACDGGRAGCLLAFLVSRFAHSAPARSLVAICPWVVALRCSIWGVVKRFTGYSCRYPVGVGVFQYMPLNGILWLLTGISGDVVRCPFSALPVASFLPLCPAFRIFPAAVSWRWCGRFPAS